MATQTNTFSILSTDWTQISPANTKALVTANASPRTDILYLFSNTKPASSKITGHTFLNENQKNTIIGTRNTDKCWVRSIGENINVEVTYL